MADPVPDPTRPDPGAGWPAHFMYQVRMFFREFGASQLGMLLITALLGYIGVQSYSNADHAEKTRAVVQESHKETAAKIDAAAATATEVKTVLAADKKASDTKLENIEKAVATLPEATAQKMKGKDK